MEDVDDWQKKFKSCKYSDKLIDKLLLLNKEAKHSVDIQEVKKAIYYAKKYHGNQMQESGGLYYSQAIEVAYMISDYNFKTEVIVATILHNIVQDTEMTAGMVLDIFGRRVEEIIDRLTCGRPDGSKLSVEQLLSNAYDRKDKEVLLIKTMERLHNIQIIGTKSPEKIKEITQDTIRDFLHLVINFEMLNVEEQLIKICSKAMSIKHPSEES